MLKGGRNARRLAGGKKVWVASFFNQAACSASLWKMPAKGCPDEKIAEPVYRVNYAVTKKGQ